MSYILDALNKSEQERRSRRAPGIETVHRTAESAPARISRWWLALLMLLILVNLGILGFWLIRPSATAPQAAVTPSAATPSPATASTPSAIPTTPGVVTRQTPEGLLVTPAPASSSPTTAPSTPLASGARPEPISDLPDNIRQQIPPMSFSSHIYSDDAKYRMVDINGNIYHEGDMVSNGMRLVRITEEGIVLSYRGYTFEVSVLHDWSFQ